MKTLLLILPTLFLVSCVSQEATLEKLTSGDVKLGGEPEVPPTLHKTHIYQAIKDRNSIRQGSIDPLTGAIDYHGEVSVDEGRAVDLVATPSKTLLFAANPSVNKIIIYSINPSTGALSYAKDESVDSSPTKLAVHPSGNVLYILHSNPAKVTTYRIDEANMDLLEMENSSFFLSGDAGSSLALDAHSNQLFASTNGSLTSLSLSPGGQITSQSSRGDKYSHLQVHPEGFLFGTVTTQGKVGAHAILAGGTLQTPLYSYLQLPAVSYKNLVFSADGHVAYALNAVENSLEAYTVTANRELIHLNTVKLSPGCSPSGLALLENQRFIYTNCTDSSGATFVHEVLHDGRLGGGVRSLAATVGSTEINSFIILQ